MASSTAEDKLKIVLCIAGIKQKYYADDGAWSNSTNQLINQSI